MRYTVRSKYLDMTDARLVREMYRDGTLALMLDDAVDYPEKITVNLSEYGLVPPEGHVYVKDNSEHEGLPDALVEAGIAVKVRQVEFGPFDACAWLMKVIAQPEGINQ